MIQKELFQEMYLEHEFPYNLVDNIHYYQINNLNIVTTWNQNEEITFPFLHNNHIVLVHFVNDWNTYHEKRVFLYDLSKYIPYSNRVSNKKDLD